MFSALLVILLLLCNAFFVAAEFAMVALRGVHIEQLRNLGKRRVADLLATLKDQVSSVVAAIQVGITISSLLIGSLAEPVLTAAIEHVLGPVLRGLAGGASAVIATAIGFAVVTYLTVVFGEQLPKVLAIRYVPVVASLVARPVALLLKLTWPLVWTMNKSANLVTRPLGLGSVEEAEEEAHTVDEIRLITAEAAESGTLTGRERSLILNSLALGRRTARQIMVPRVKVAFLDLRRSMEHNRKVMNEQLYSRLPLCDGSIDQRRRHRARRASSSPRSTPRGTRACFNCSRARRSFAPSSISLDKLLVLVDERRTQMVILVDEHGGTEGIVTLRDIVDELVGSADRPDRGGARTAWRAGASSSRAPRRFTRRRSQARAGDLHSDGSVVTDRRPGHRAARPVPADRRRGRTSAS